ncbi:AraC family transcriptional regulator [Pseudoclavibacter sp. 13-3]|uniref:AraC family transcriptional regulator n=1 Tax=Pseudoclavibacter sp. 13-3 TaxID=2901228 RepID=UPI001E4B5E78|nr:AraC family transcriptional regulator [Pseudoclavibacter sp. 13-3]MCD7102239.1 AraC family transcriptional regulator [Pseudoclavibacter sp. 13-3]
MAKSPQTVKIEGTNSLPRDEQHGIGHSKFVQETPQPAEPAGTLMVTSRGTHRISIGMNDHLLTPGMALWIPASTRSPHALAASTSHPSTPVPVVFAAGVVHPGPFRLPTGPTGVLMSSEIQHAVLQHISHRLMHGCDQIERLGLCLTACTRTTIDIAATIAAQHPLPTHIPRAQTEQIKTVARTLREHPADNRSITSFAAEIGVSAKTVQRAFRKELGMSFSHYHTVARVLYALERLTPQSDLTALAQSAGYRSVQTFSHAFRQHLGLLPSTVQRTSHSLLAAPAPALHR